VFAFIFTAFISHVAVLLHLLMVAFVGNGLKYNSTGNGQKKSLIVKPAKAGKLGKCQLQIGSK